MLAQMTMSAHRFLTARASACVGLSACHGSRFLAFGHLWGHPCRKSTQLVCLLGVPGKPGHWEGSMEQASSSPHPSLVVFVTSEVIPINPYRKPSK